MIDRDNSEYYKEIVTKIRSEYNKYSKIEDEVEIQTRLSEGYYQLKILNNYLTTSHNNSNINNNIPLISPEDETFGAASDIKGRIGIHWPWE